MYNIFENIIIATMIFLYTLFSFYNYYDRRVFTIFNTTGLITYSIAVIMRLNTAYFDQGNLIYDRRLIANKYRNTILFNDLLGFFSLVYQFAMGGDRSLQTRILCVFFLAKYQIYYYNLVKIEEKLNLSGGQVHFWSLFKLLGNSLLICHIVGTLYFFLAWFEKEVLRDDNNWVTHLNMDDSSPFEQYVESYYWAIATVTLIGTKGITTLEAIFTITTLLVTVGVFATILSAVTIVWEAKEAKEKEFKKDNDVMTSFFTMHSLSKTLQGKFHNYLKYSFQGHKQKMVNIQFEELIQKFPLSMQKEVIQERYQSIINNWSLLSQNFSEYAIKELVFHFKEEYFMPSEIIIHQDSLLPDPQLYFILEGKVEIYRETLEKENIVKVLQEGNHFGYDTFFTDQEPQFSIKSSANSYTTVLAISRSLFLDIISERDEDHEKFMMIQDELKFQGYSNILKHDCYICKKSCHIEQDCNLLNYRLNIPLFLGRHTHSGTNERNKGFQRKPSSYKIKFNSQKQRDLYPSTYPLLKGVMLEDFWSMVQLGFQQSEDALEKFKEIQDYNQQINDQQERSDTFKNFTEEDDKESSSLSSDSSSSSDYSQMTINQSHEGVKFQSDWKKIRKSLNNSKGNKSNSSSNPRNNNKRNSNYQDTNLKQNQKNNGDIGEQISITSSDSSSSSGSSNSITRNHGQINGLPFKSSIKLQQAQKKEKKYGTNSQISSDSEDDNKKSNKIQDKLGFQRSDTHKNVENQQQQQELQQQYQQQNQKQQSILINSQYTKNYLNTSKIQEEATEEDQTDDQEEKVLQQQKIPSPSQQNSTISEEGSQSQEDTEEEESEDEGELLSTRNWDYLKIQSVSLSSSEPQKIKSPVRSTNTRSQSELFNGTASQSKLSLKVKDLNENNENQQKDDQYEDLVTYETPDVKEEEKLPQISPNSRPKSQFFQQNQKAQSQFGQPLPPPPQLGNKRSKKRNSTRTINLDFPFALRTVQKRLSENTVKQSSQDTSDMNASKKSMMNSSTRKKFEISENREKLSKNYKNKQTALLEVDEEEPENEKSIVNNKYQQQQLYSSPPPVPEKKEKIQFATDTKKRYNENSREEPSSMVQSPGLKRFQNGVKKVQTLNKKKKTVVKEESLRPRKKSEKSPNSQLRSSLAVPKNLYNGLTLQVPNGSNKSFLGGGGLLTEEDQKSDTMGQLTAQQQTELQLGKMFFYMINSNNNNGGTNPIFLNQQQQQQQLPNQISSNQQQQIQPQLPLRVRKESQFSRGGTIAETPQQTPQNMNASSRFQIHRNSILQKRGSILSRQKKPVLLVNSIENSNNSATQRFNMFSSNQTGGHRKSSVGQASILQQTVEKLQQQHQSLLEQSHFIGFGEQEFGIEIDKLKNFRFYFIYNNAEFTIPSFNLQQNSKKKKHLKLDKSKKKYQQNKLDSKSKKLF